MKLNDFFQDQKNQSFTDVDKLELYQKFLYKRTAKSPVKRFAFVHAKSFVYTMVVTVLLLWSYGTYFLNNTSIFVSNLVQADYIAKVLSVVGDFSIEHQGQVSQNENISNGDTIILSKGAEMLFEISSGTKSKIIWPAKLTIQQVSEDTTKYKLNLIYGDYIQMEWNSLPQNIELAIDDILIKQADKSQPINYQFVNEGRGHVLKNNGGSLLFSKNGNIKETQIKNKQVLAIQNDDIQVFKSWETFSVAMKKWEVSQTFAINTPAYTNVKTAVVDTTTWTTSDESPLSWMALLAPTDDITQVTTLPESDTDAISKNIASLVGGDKSVMTTEQNTLLRSILLSTFLNDEVKDIYTDKVWWTDSVAKIAVNIRKLCAWFGMTYSADESITSNISTLSQILQQKFTIPPVYINNLNTLKNWLSMLASVGAASPSWEEFQKTMPANLVFGK